MAAGATYFPLATTTLASAAASYTFSSIPSTYTDIILVINGGTTVNGQFRLQVGNGSVDTASNYSGTQMYAYSTTVGAGRETAATNPYVGATSTNKSIHTIQFMNYSNTTTYKTWLNKGGDTGQQQNDVSVYLWRSTSAINIIKLASDGGSSISAGTTLTLYGIKAA
jgi:hypothetical protein